MRIVVLRGLELELQGVVSYPVWVLRPKLLSSARRVLSLNC